VHWHSSKEKDADTVTVRERKVRLAYDSHVSKRKQRAAAPYNSITFVNENQSITLKRMSIIRALLCFAPLKTMLFI